ncbi:hypothetical protein BDW62DRAFT_194256 [Aspergillus aurantiobrunneus]
MDPTTNVSRQNVPRPAPDQSGAQPAPSGIKTDSSSIALYGSMDNGQTYNYLKGVSVTNNSRFAHGNLSRDVFLSLFCEK